jgi:hypothetical protein
MDKTDTAFNVAQRFQANREALKDLIRLAKQSLDSLEKVDPHKPSYLHSSFMHTRDIADLATGIHQRNVVNDAVLAAMPNLLTGSTEAGDLMLKALITGCPGPSSRYEYEPTGRTVRHGLSGEWGPEMRLVREISSMPGKKDVVRKIPKVPSAKKNRT